MAGSGPVTTALIRIEFPGESETVSVPGKSQMGNPDDLGGHRLEERPVAGRGGENLDGRSRKKMEQLGGESLGSGSEG